MSEWKMLTLVGSDQPGIVAAVTEVLHQHGCNLGETSMMRLGGNFTIMMMVAFRNEREALSLLQPVVDRLGLHLHVDEIDGTLHSHIEPNVRVSVHGADRAGIVAQVTQVLADGGFNILDLASDVAGSNESPLYILHIEGSCSRSPEELKAGLSAALGDQIRVSVSAIETLLG